MLSDGLGGGELMMVLSELTDVENELSVGSSSPPFNRLLSYGELASTLEMLIGELAVDELSSNSDSLNPAGE